MGVVGVFDGLVSELKRSLPWVRVVGVFNVLVSELKRSFLQLPTNQTYC